MKNLFAYLATACLLLLSTISTATDGLMIDEKSAWARATPPGSSTTAIYVTLMNHSSSDISVTAVATSVSDRAELHTHTSEDGVMKMQQVSALIVPAGGQTQLKPHGDHIMVFNLQEQLIAGKEVNVELTLDDGKTQTLSVPIFKESPTTGHDSANHKDMKHEEMENKQMAKDPDATHNH